MILEILSIGRGLALSLATLSAFYPSPATSSSPLATRQTNDTAHGPDLATPFHLSDLTLGSGPWAENQARTLRYAKWIDLERILYVFRQNHDLSTEGAQQNGGWDAPDFPFRSHFQGHFLTAWAHCYAVLGDEECRDRAEYFVAELAECQANNEAAGFNEGYLSGFPESEIDRVENRTLDNGNVPYYALHKTMAGLLDAWRYAGVEQAVTVLRGMADWVDFRTGRLSYVEMQESLRTEFGGMNEILADMARHLAEDADEAEHWLEVAARFDHEAVFAPLAAGRDELEGLHANTQIPKWIGAVLEYKGTGEERYLRIARNAWDMTVQSHSYAIGANSVAEHFRGPDEIVGYLDHDTAEACNSYNMLKLTRELWALEPDNAAYFDFYELTLLNHLIGQQEPSSDHGHVTYFTSLEPAGRRGVGPVWGGGTFSTDYDSFWCCQGTALETNTKLMDSVFFHDNDSLWVNLFVPAGVTWAEKGVSVVQTTEYPASDETTLQFSGGGSTFALKVRIPAWAEGAEISVNGEEVGDDSVESGSYATVEMTWNDGDEVTIRLPMSLRLIEANDDPSVAAVAYGPTILAGNYGDRNLSSIPALDVGSIERVGDDLEFEARAENGTVSLGPFNAAHGFNYNTYWRIQGELS